MQINLNDFKPNTLLLTVRSEPYERECDYFECCEGRIGTVADNLDCPACHGTGQRTVRLRGVVNPDHPYITDLFAGWSMMNMTLGHRTQRDRDDQLRSVVNSIINDYRNNTLPDAVREGLREEDVE